MTPMSIVMSISLYIKLFLKNRWLKRTYTRVFVGFGTACCRWRLSLVTEHVDEYSYKVYGIDVNILHLIF